MYALHPVIEPPYHPAPPYTREEAGLFWLYVERKRGCWPWHGALTPEGAPYYLTQTTCHAQRAAWEFFHGPCPVGFRVIPRCSNTRCMRLDHLLLSTRRVRILPYDTGYAPSRTSDRLTAADVRAIRRAAKTGGNTSDVYRALASEFHCSFSNILRVVRAPFRLVEP